MIKELVKIDKSTFTFDTAPLELNSSAVTTTQSQKVLILGNNGDAMPDNQFGQLILDMQGLNVHKNKIIIDWNHEPIEIGFSKNFYVDEDFRLWLPTTLTGVDQKSKDVIENLRMTDEDGNSDPMPYEASVSINPQLTQYVADGEVAFVNGREIEGEAMIVRRWALRACAITPMGRDKNTSVEMMFSENKNNTIEVMQMSQSKTDAVDAEAVDEVELTSEDNSVEAEENKEAVELAVETVEAPVAEVEVDKEETVADEVASDEVADDADAQSSDEESEADVEEVATDENEAKEVKLSLVELSLPYVEKFGKEKGLEYFIAEKDFTECLSEDHGSLKTRIAELEAENAALKLKSKTSKGLSEPVAVDAVELAAIAEKDLEKVHFSKTMKVQK